jgi:hypothetical protein
MISQNTALGFDQMRAAIVGGHDIADAFAELMGMAATAKDMSVMQGGFACLLACLRLIETHMSIDEVLPGSPMAELLAMSPINRADHVDQLLIANRRSEIASLAAMMIGTIKPFTKSFSFSGSLGRELTIHFKTE